VYKTRVAIGRTLTSLQEGILHLPFLWYGNMFLRVSHAVSRQQEYAADALAARVVGAGPLISGLKLVHRAGAAFQPYWRGELAPVLSAGFRPPVAAGFAAFMNAEPISQETATFLAREMDSPTASPYDTHPALRDRIAALGDEGSLQSDTAAISALSLLDDVDALERELLTAMFPAEGCRAFEHVGWSDTLTAIYLPAWRSTVKPHLDSLAGIHLGDLPGLVQDPPQLVARFSKTLEASMPDDQKPRTVAGILWMAVTLALHSRGVPITCDVGYPIRARIGSTMVNTASIVGDLASSELARSSWRALMAENGLANLDLGGDFSIQSGRDQNP
jgi:hypothetical protein